MGEGVHLLVRKDFLGGSGWVTVVWSIYDLVRRDEGRRMRRRLPPKVVLQIFLREE